MVLEPAVDVADVVDALAESLRRPMSLVGELDLEVYWLRCGDTTPDLVVRAFGPSVAESTVEAAARVLTQLAGTRFPAERAADSPVLPVGRRATPARDRVRRADTGAQSRIW